MRCLRVLNKESYPGDRFVMESTVFYEPLYDFIESRGLSVIFANPRKIKLKGKVEPFSRFKEIASKFEEHGYRRERYFFFYGRKSDHVHNLL